MALRVVVDNRVRVPARGLPEGVERELKDAFTHVNPEWGKKRAIGVSTWGVPEQIQTWRREGACLTFPRGGMQRVRGALLGAGIAYEVADARSEGLACTRFPRYVGHEPRWYQEAAIEAILRKEQGIVRAPTGCISGDAIVELNRAGKSFRTTLRNLVHMHGGGNSLTGSKTKWDPRIPTKIRMRTADGFIRLGTLVDAWASGVRRTYLVTTSTGRTVRATLDHRFLTTSGWKRLGKIPVGTFVHVDAGAVGEGTPRKPKLQYRIVNGVKFHPHAGRRGVRPDKGGWSVPLHRLVAEASLNRVPLEDFVAHLRRGSIAADRDYVFLDPKVHHVHHVDEDPTNNAPENLVVTTASEHHTMHGKNGGWRKVTSRSTLEEIVSIGEPRNEHTFDVEVLEGDHNFLADGFVVHNSGKTELAFALIGRIGLNALVILPTGGLFKQWSDRAAEAFGLRRDALGVVQGKTRRLRPITIAMQQTLARGVPEDVRDFFGAVVIDECFERSTKVLMADGTHRRIAEVRVGDVVAVGGRVLGVTNRWYEGPAHAIGDSIATTQHPVATSRGWVAATSVDSGDNIYEDPLHAGRQASEHEERPALRRVPGTDASRLQASRVCPVQEESLSGWEVSGLRGMGGGGVPWWTRLDDLRRGPMEPRSDRGDIRGVEADGRAPAGREETRAKRAVEADVSRPDVAREVGGQPCPRSAKTVRGPRGEEAERATCEGGDCRWEDESLRRAQAWQRDAADRLGGGDGPPPGTARVRSRARRQDEREASPLQDRSREPIGDGGSGDRRFESLRCTEVGRRAEDDDPPVARVARAALPGAVRLREGRGRVHPLGVDFAGTVYNLATEGGVYVAGGVLVHNCQLASARTYVEVVDQFPARYRVAVSADERRSDRKEFLAYDLFGKVEHEIGREQLVDQGHIVDVEIRVVPTGFRADWYGMPEDGEDPREIDFNRLLDEMTNDPKRNALIHQFVGAEVMAGEQAIVLTARRDHARTLEPWFVAREVASGYLLGDQGPGDEAEYDRTRWGIMDGSVQLGIGTYKALGFGIDLPAVAVGAAVTPIAGNPQQMNQVRGRLCRPAKGKGAGRLYYLWDRNVYPGHLAKIIAKNPTVTVWDGRRFVDAREWERRRRAGGRLRRAS